MIIDCHGHYTTAPKPLRDYREQQIAALKSPQAAPLPDPKISDDQIRESLEGAQLKTQKERGHDLTLFSPIAGQMAHHIGNQQTSETWTRVCNDLIHRVTKLYPDKFIGVCQLPQSPGVEPKNCIKELERCVKEYGFVGCNLNPDPSGGYWKDPPLTDKWYYPLYEKMVELNVPAMVHVSSSCNPCFHHTGAHYINGDTTAFMQFLTSDLFKDFPTLKFVIPHGGGAVPYHWGRYRGLAQDMGKPLLKDLLLNNVFFDTCVYHKPGIELLLKVIPADNVLYATEMFGAVKGVDPETGHNYDDTKRYVEALDFLSAADREKIFHSNALKVYPRLKAEEIMAVARFLATAICSALAALLPGAAYSQDFPTKTVRMIASGSGGGGDVATRLIAQGLTKTYPHQVIVDNRGIIGIEIAAKSVPDGYTLLFYGSTVWLQPLLAKEPHWDPIKDFSPITWAIKSPNVLVVHPSVPVTSVKELIALAKAKPGVLNYSSGATGTSSHLAAELFNYTAGVNIVRIPYKSGASEMADLLGGHVQMTFGSGGSVGPHVRSGKLRGIAVTTAEPSALFPNLPTIGATGVPGYEAAAMSGVWAPAKTPAALINRLNQDIVRVLNTAEVKEKYFSGGVETVGSTPAVFGAKIKSEMERLGKVIKAAGIRED